MGRDDCTFPKNASYDFKNFSRNIKCSIPEKKINAAYLTMCPASGNSSKFLI